MFSKIIKYIKHPSFILYKLDLMRIITLDDVTFLKIGYKERLGKKLDLDNPKTFNEKLQWLKIHDRNPEYTTMVDKEAVKKYIAEKVGSRYIIPTLGVYNNFDEIDFDKLPERFVLKCTHDSGSAIIVKNKANFNRKEAKNKIVKSLRKNYYYSAREWPYKNVEPKIIIEDYIEDDDGSLNDYKFFVFSGKVKYIQVDYDRFVFHKRNIYSVNWEYQPFSIEYPTDGGHIIEKPSNLNEMIDLAERIAIEIGCPSFVRVDLYNVVGRIIFGELTFYHGAGFEKISPKRYERIFSELIILPDIGKTNEK